LDLLNTRQFSTILKGDDGMKMRWFAPLPNMTLAVMLTLVVGQGLMLAPEACAQDNKDVLEGTWLNTVKIINCNDRDVVFITFESMTTYMHGGTLIEGGTPRGGPP